MVRLLQLPAGHASFDYVVLVSAGSDRLTNALVEEVWHFCKRHNVPRLPVEGESGWMLIDCYDVIVHAQSEEKRAYYELDTLWPLAREIAWEKEAKKLGDPDKAPKAEDAPKAPKRRTAVKRSKQVDADENTLDAAAVAAAEAARPEVQRTRRPAGRSGDVRSAAPRPRKPRADGDDAAPRRAPARGAKSTAVRGAKTAEGKSPAAPKRTIRRKTSGD